MYRYGGKCEYAALDNINICTIINYMRQPTTFEEDAEKAELLRQNNKRVLIEVRDAMRILGYKSTGATLPVLRRLVERGLIEYEPAKDGKKKGKFFLS